MSIASLFSLPLRSPQQSQILRSSLCKPPEKRKRETEEESDTQPEISDLEPSPKTNVGTVSVAVALDPDQSSLYEAASQTPN